MNYNLLNLLQNNITKLNKTNIFESISLTKSFFSLDLEQNFPEQKEILSILFPYSIDIWNSKSKYNTSKNFNYTDLTTVYKLYSFFYSDPSPLISLDRITKKSQIVAKRLINLNLDSFIHMNKKRGLYIYFFFKFKHRFYINQLEKYNDSSFLNELQLDYLNENYYLNNTYYWHLIFQNPPIQKLINFLNKKGKKEKAEFIVYKMIQLINLRHKTNPIDFIGIAINNVKPIIKSEQIPFGRRKQTVPTLISLRKQYKLAYKWIIDDVNNNLSKKPYFYKLYLAFSNAFFQKGAAFDLKIQTHKLAYDQRAYMYKNYYLKKRKKIQFLTKKELST